jgi:hypothetical protein
MPAVFASRLAEQCADESGAGRLHQKAVEVALIAIQTCTGEDRQAWKRAVRNAYRQSHPECGSFFLIFVLPVLISLVTQWLSKWIFKQDIAVIEALREQAATDLGLRRRSEATPTSTNTPPMKPSESST